MKAVMGTTKRMIPCGPNPGARATRCTVCLPRAVRWASVSPSPLVER